MNQFEKLRKKSNAFIKMLGRCCDNCRADKAKQACGCNCTTKDAYDEMSKSINEIRKQKKKREACWSNPANWGKA